MSSIFEEKIECLFALLKKNTKFADKHQSNKQMRSKLFLILLFATLFACAQKQKYVSILESCEYKKALNRTEYMRFPYGKAYIDGKWTKKDYLQSSRQQLFVSEDSVALTIAFCDIKGFDFNKKPRKKGFEFLKALRNTSYTDSIMIIM